MLDVAGNYVYDAGATELSGALRVNTTLTSLGLGSESLSYRIVQIVDVGSGSACEEAMVLEG